VLRSKWLCFKGAGGATADQLAYFWPETNFSFIWMVPLIPWQVLGGRASSAYAQCSSRL